MRVKNTAGISFIQGALHGGHPDLYVSCVRDTAKARLETWKVINIVNAFCGCSFIIVQ